MAFEEAVRIEIPDEMRRRSRRQGRCRLHPGPHQSLEELTTPRQASPGGISLTRRVVVTGVGLVSALGVGREETWSNLWRREWRRAYHSLRYHRLSVSFAAEVKEFDPSGSREKKN